jgi:hypothetical protein
MTGNSSAAFTAKASQEQTMIDAKNRKDIEVNLNTKSNVAQRRHLQPRIKGIARIGQDFILLRPLDSFVEFVRFVVPASLRPQASMIG